MARPSAKPRRPGARSAAAILVRLSAEEHRILTEAAKKDGLPVSAWLRFLAMREASRG